MVSQDSDCFAYGARRVYRNFSVSNSAGGGALQGSVDCYDAEAMYNSNGKEIFMVPIMKRFITDEPLAENLKYLLAFQ